LGNHMYVIRLEDENEHSIDCSVTMKSRAKSL
jgi:hypothetical protein